MTDYFTTRTISGDFGGNYNPDNFESELSSEGGFSITFVKTKGEDDIITIVFNGAQDLTVGDETLIDTLVTNHNSLAAPKIQVNTQGAAGTIAKINVQQTGNTTWTIPDATDESLGANASQVIANKKLNATNNEIVDASDDTKVAKFQVSGANAGTYTKLICNQTGNREIEFPDASDTLAGLNVSQTFQNKSLVDSNTMIVDDITPSKELNFQLAGAGASSRLTLASIATGIRTVTFPDLTTTLVGTNTTDTLLNKTVQNLINTGYYEFDDMSAPSNPANGKGRLYKKTGNDGLFWKPDSGGAERDLTDAPSKDSFDGYTNSSATVAGSYVQIPWNVVDFDSTSFTHVSNSTEVQIGVTGKYKITYNVTLLHTSGGSRTSSIANLFKNGSVIAGTESRGYHRNSSQGEASYGRTRIISLTSGDVITVRVARFSGGGPLQLLAGGCSLVIERK